MTVALFAHLIVLFAIGFLLSKQETVAWKLLFWPGLLLKLLAGVGVGLLYMYYYPEGGDTLWYFSDGSKMAALARTDFIAYINFLSGSTNIIEDISFTEPRVLFMSKLVSLFCLLTQDHYWLTAAYLSLICFVAAWYLVKELVMINARWTVAASIAFLFFPSVVLWSAGIIKESIAISCLYFLVWLLLRLWSNKKIPLIAWLLLPLSLWVLWNLKYYYLALFLPVATTLIVMQRIVLPYVKLPVWMKAVVWCGVFLMPLYLASKVHPNFYPERFLNVIVENYQAFTKISAPEDQVMYNNLEPNVQGIIMDAPLALIAALFRPFIWEAGTLFQLLSSLENMFVLILTGAAFLQIRRAVFSPYRLLIFSTLTYVVLLAVFLALSTPNFGTLIRYRVGFMPFFVLIILIDNPVLIFITKRIDFYRKRFFKPFQ